jgi:hypothetical protein
MGRAADFGLVDAQPDIKASDATKALSEQARRTNVIRFTDALPGNLDVRILSNDILNRPILIQAKRPFAGEKQVDLESGTQSTESSQPKCYYSHCTDHSS